MVLARVRSDVMKRRAVLMVMSAAVALVGCGGQQTPKPATSVVGAPSATAATVAPSDLANRLWAADARMKNRRPLAAYQRKVAYLQQECTQQGNDLLVIVRRVHTKIRAVRGTGWYGALDHMASLSSGPQSDCSEFAAKA